MTEQTIINADCMDTMADMDENSVHAVVTDPPYGLAFMPGVNEWDEFDSPEDYQDFCEEWAAECRRILKPGGHLIAFSGSRTYGRLMCGVQDAGFEIRDTITWHYSEGLVGGKAQDVTNNMDDEGDIEEWEGFKMGLKPATEFAVVARKGFDPPTHDNVLEHGTGALNIDRTRVPSEGERSTADAGFIRRGRSDEEVFMGSDESGEKGGSYKTTKGRYPSNLLIDEEAAQMMDEQTGREGEPVSRFFYTPKSSKSEQTINGQVENNHSTVKPLQLMEWLVTLVTVPGQRVLDPFAGSGTTIMACRRLDREGVGIEKDADHADLARQRVDLAHELETERVDATGTDELDKQPNDSPTTLESFGDD